MVDKTKNKGRARAGKSKTRFYLSLDAQPSENDQLLDGRHGVPALKPDDADRAMTSVTIDATANPGSYYLVACADDTDKVSESNEGDNCKGDGSQQVTVTYVNPEDADGDGVQNSTDNCPEDSNPDQLDADGDGKGDVCDACPNDANPGTAECPNLVDFCALYTPTTIMQTSGTVVTIYGRVGEPGIQTDASSANDPTIDSQVGYGPDGSNPETAGWVFVDAAANPGYTEGSPGYNASHDEHVGSFTAPGEYDTAYRFSLDDGASYAYCDTGAGSTDGYSAANAGQMTVTP